MRFVDQATDILNGLAGLFVSPQSSVYWLYLLSTLTLAALVCLATVPGRPSPAALLRRCLPREIYLGAGLRRDVAMLLLNTLLYSFFMAPFLVSAQSVSLQVWRLLDAGFGAMETPLQGIPVRIALTAFALLAVDLAFFVSHWLQHRVGLLWEFHKVHHSAESLNPFTAFRRHPVDVAVEGALSGLLTGVVFGGFDYLSGGNLAMLTLMGVNAGLFLFLMFGAHLQHSHLPVSYGPVVNRLLVSPAMHQIHHSSDPAHFNCNFGNIFSFWDGLFATRRLPAGVCVSALGLEDGEQTQYRGLLRLYLLPFVKLGRIMRIRLNRSGKARDSSATAGR